MRSFSPYPANSRDTARIHPALTGFADEVCATLARLSVYVGTLALIGILGTHFWDLWDAAGGVARQGELEPGPPLLSCFCRQRARSIRKNRYLYHPSASRRRPQGHPSLGRQGWQSHRRARNLPSGRGIRPEGFGRRRSGRTDHPNWRIGIGAGGRRRQQVRHGDAGSAPRRQRGSPAMPWLHQALRGAGLADLRLVVSGQRLAGAARGNRLHAEPADPVDLRK
jgi:hypothetical protein